MASEEETFHDPGLFQEPEGYYQSPKDASFAEHRLLSGEVLRLRLVGHSPLWGHLLWNAGRNVAAHLEEHAGSMVHQRQILELGAGAGLPSLVSAIMGAKKVVVTDYPELELIENLQFNISSCHLLPPSSVVPQGFLWGSSPDELLAMTEAAQGFDLLILADLLFNHSEHQKLLSTVRSTLRKSADAQALVFFTPYRPWLYEKDMAFFDLAQKGGFSVHKIMEKTLEKVMFENDPGDEVLRRTVYGYSLHWLWV